MQTRITCVAISSLLVALTVGCASDSTSPNTAKPVTAASPGSSAQSIVGKYDWAGKYHNDALAYALTKIKASNKLSKLDRCKVGLSAMVDFQKAYRKAGGPATFDDVTITRGMCESAFAPATGASLIDRIDVGRANDISPTASDYMNQIVSQVDFAASVPALSFAVAQIENQAYATVDLLEAGAVEGTGSIAVSSATYWTTSGGSWSDTQLQYSKDTNRQTASISGLTPQSPVFAVTERTRRIIKADILAAIGVLVYDWWMGEAAIGKACIKAAAASLIAGLSAT